MLKVFIIFLRHILAIVHFNQNLHREVRTSQDGVAQVKIVYPKFKNGDATVRDVRVKQNFGKCRDFLASSSGRARQSY